MDFLSFHLVQKSPVTSIWQHVLERHYIDQPDTIHKYSGTALQLLLKLNFPLVVLWSPIGYLINVGLSSSSLNLPSGLLGTALIVAADVVILASVAAFWYLIAVELEARRHGSSMVRLEARTLETVKAVALVIVGVAAVVYACWDAHRLLLLGQLNHNLFWSGILNAVLGGFVLLIWAILLIKISVQDFRIAAERRNAAKV